MPSHLADHLSEGRHVPGVFIVNPAMNIMVLASTLTLVAAASLENEYRDQILYLPELES